MSMKEKREWKTDIDEPECDIIIFSKKSHLVLEYAQCEAPMHGTSV